jgi:hypothetical protein
MISFAAWYLQRDELWHEWPSEYLFGAERKRAPAVNRLMLKVKSELAKNKSRIRNVPNQNSSISKNNFIKSFPPAQCAEYKTIKGTPGRLM